MNFAPASTAMSMLVVDRIPPSTSSRSLIARGGDGRGDRDVVPAGAAEHDPLARVEVGGGEVQLRRQRAEIVGSARLGQHGPHVPLQSRSRVQAGWQELGEPQHEVDHRDLSQVPHKAPQQLRQPPRRERSASEVLAVVGS